MSEHDGCTGCKYFKDNEVTHSSPCYDCEGAHSQNKLKDNYTPMTNADKIRSMSDEELAELLINAEIGKYQFTNHAYPFVKATEWLQIEVKESETE